MGHENSSIAMANMLVCEVQYYVKTCKFWDP